MVDDPIATEAPEIATYSFKEASGAAPFVTNFALDGTQLSIEVIADSHFIHTQTAISTGIPEKPLTFEVSTDVLIGIYCAPRSYAVKFNLLGKGTSDKAPTQYITYYHVAEKPLEQYDIQSQKIIVGWYLDRAYTQEWNFNECRVESDIELYAKWETYNTPTILTMKLPAGETTVTLRYTQNGGRPVRIHWGESSDPDALEVYRPAEGEPEYGRIIKLSHTYVNDASEDKLYYISIYGPNNSDGNTIATYTLGGGHYESPLVTPIKCLVDISFS
jgi:hypothetical protein